MSRSATWLDRARTFILTLDIPADATLKDTRRIFREHGWAFHGGTYWGRKKWGKATREFQIRRGLLPPPKMAEYSFPADIIFPFREPQQ
ncbi:MAG: hypothetical protein ABIO86_17105 [Sphingomonas sp.]